MTVCSYHVTYAIQSESTLYSCLNVKQLLARSRREINGCKKEVIKKKTETQVESRVEIDQSTILQYIA